MRAALALLACLVAGAAQAQLAGGDPALVETRYCGEPKRDARGRIVRRADVRSAFRKRHACPATKSKTGPCPGWQMDHVVPLACGGCDAVRNMQWMPTTMKTAPRTGKDRFERLVYCTAP